MTIREMNGRVDELSRSGAFDAAWYINTYPDVIALGMSPAEHYVWLGERLGRKPAAEPDPSIDTDEYQVVAAAMRGDFYELTYPDVSAAGVDPVSHYIMFGWREGRDPSINFSTQYYIEQNPDVEKAGINPFYHWLVAGRSEGREGRHQLGFRYDILSRLKPVHEQISEVKGRRKKLLLSPAHALEKALGPRVSAGQIFAVSFSHDDISQNVGGVQLLVRREMQLLAAHEIGHMHFFPAYSLDYLDTTGDDVVLGVLIGGAFAGYFSFLSVTEAVGALDFKPDQARLVIHNLLGHNIDQVLAIVSEFGISEGCFWLHDYAALYNNFKLLRNDLQYTGVPKVGSMAYELCEFARADFSHAIEFGKLFSTLKLHLLSPSQAALDIWNDAELHRTASKTVSEHLRLEHRSNGPVVKPRPLRVAFLGHAAAHKGWLVFEELVFRFGDDPRYDFYHLGQNQKAGLLVNFRKVIANERQLDAMRQAVVDSDIDVALVWSIWPETFCLVAYEARAGGAAVLTHPDSGNVAAQVNAGLPGAIFTDESSLYDAFEQGVPTDFERSRRGVTLSEIVYSDLSLPMLLKGFAL